MTCWVTLERHLPSLPFLPSLLPRLLSSSSYEHTKSTCCAYVCLITHMTAALSLLIPPSHVSPHTTIAGCCYVSPHTTVSLSSYHVCVLIILYTCVRILLCVSSYCYICVLILQHVYPHTIICVSSYCYICVLILLYVCPHTAIHVASYCCFRPHALVA